MSIRTICLSVFCSVLFSAMNTNSHGQTFEWANQMGNMGWDEGTSIAVDGEGNVYTTGNFRGTVDFDPGIGVFDLSSVGERDIFISRSDGEGNFIWAKRFGGIGFEESNAIAIAPNGEIYATGSFTGQIDFDPGAGIFNLTSSGWDRDVFVLKLDPSGNLLWAKQISGASPTPTSTPSPTNAFSIAVDSMGSVFTTGYFDGTVDFDPDTISIFDLSVSEATDIFVSKLDAAGNFVWAKQFGGTQGGIGYAIAVDGNSNVYSTGTIGGTVDFDPGPDTFLLATSVPFQTEIYISKLDASGNFVWARPMSPGEGSTIAVGGNGNVYASGWYPSGTPSVINKLNSSGDLVWAKQSGGINGRSLALDHSGNVYTMGACFLGANDFDPGPGVFDLVAGASDAFISKLDSSGNFVWAGLLASTDQLFAKSLAIDNDNNVFTTGYFVGTADFDPDTTTFDLSTPPSYNYNVFVQKLSSTLSVGFSENSSESQISVYPNPTEGSLIIEFEREYEDIDLILRNIIGKVVQTELINNSDRVEIQINEPSGIYILEISDRNNKKAIIRIIKK